jgi:plastocyanin
MLRIPLSGAAVVLAAGLIVAAVVMGVGGGSQTATASHGTFNVHVHDDYFHPTGSFVPGVNHVNAQALCMQAQPDTTCTSVIHVAPGDSINWISPAPLAANPHTVTECTDASYSNCGAAVDPINPINDSGVRNPPNPGPSGWPYNVGFPQPGFYYYRCEIHPNVMRGVVQVIANNGPPGGVGGIAGLIGGSEAPVVAPQVAGESEGSNVTLVLGVAAAAAMVIVLSAGATYALRRVRRDG